MDETKPPAHGAKGDPDDADPDKPGSESPAPPPPLPAQTAPGTEPDEADDDWVSL